jgi:hypothetical protein
VTPLEIEILLHYYCRADDWRNGDHSAPILKDTFHRFLEDNLLTHANFHVERFEDGTLKARYEVTDRGKAYCEALQALPLPIKVWVMPNERAA